MGNPEFYMSAVRERADYNDSYRAKNGLPHTDSDIRHLIQANDELTDMVERLAKELMPDTSREHWREMGMELAAKQRR